MHSRLPLSPLTPRSALALRHDLNTLFRMYTYTTEAQTEHGTEITCIDCSGRSPWRWADRHALTIGTAQVHGHCQLNRPAALLRCTLRARPPALVSMP